VHWVSWRVLRRELTPIVAGRHHRDDSAREAAALGPAGRLGAAVHLPGPARAAGQDASRKRRSGDRGRVGRCVVVAAATWPMLTPAPIRRAAGCPAACAAPRRTLLRRHCSAGGLVVAGLNRQTRRA
jgi:hypothetical protein